MRRAYLVPAILLAALRAGPAAAQLTDSQEAVVHAYLSAVDSVKSMASPGGLEAALNAFETLRDTLMSVQETHLTLLESLPEEDYRRLAGTLPGAFLEREVFVCVLPEPAYFASLAAARGDSADRAFFAAYAATYPESTLCPVYQRPWNDACACTRFGSLSLVETYRLWTGFQRRFPGRYAKPAAWEIRAVAGELGQGSCACGDLEGVKQELREFLREFPESPLAPAVERRLDALKAGRSGIRPHCRAG